MKMTPRQRAYALAAERKMSITENHEGNGATIRVEAPRGCNFGSEHELVMHWYSGSDWLSVIKDIIDAPVYPCDAQSDCWRDGACEWWSSETVAE